MRRLSFELIPAPRSRLGWLLLAVALLVAAGESALYLSLQQELSRLQQRLAAAESPPSPLPRRQDDPRAQAIRVSLTQAGSVIESLALPWSRLFEAVEAAGDEGVALLALEPDAPKRLLGIRGEAGDYPALLAYLARLEQVPLLSEVHLTSHEMRHDDPQHPLVFTIAARWRTEP